MATVTHSQAKATITFQTGFFAEIINIDFGTIKRAILDCTNMSIPASSETYGNMISIPSFYVDPGEMTVECNYNPDTTPPIGAAPATCTVACGGDTSQATIAGSAYMTEISSIKMPLDGTVMRGTYKVKFTGPITVTPGS